MSKNESEMFSNKTPVLTFDTDWAPDYAIDYVVKKLEKWNIRATWFVTHDSQVIQKLKNNSLFEVGIHPNFRENSTQGKSVDEVLRNMKKIAPNAKSTRMHGLLQSTDILLKLNQYDIENDVSILLDHQSFLRPYYSNYYQITRIPYFWEDDLEMLSHRDWEDVEKYFSLTGLKIFDFHPIHIFLNSSTMETYEKIKLNGYPKIDESQLLKHRNEDVGVDTFFEKFLEKLNNFETFTITEISEMFKKNKD